MYGYFFRLFRFPRFHANTPQGVVAYAPSGVVAYTPSGVVAYAPSGAVAYAPSGVVAYAPSGQLPILLRESLLMLLRKPLPLLLLVFPNSVNKCWLSSLNYKAIYFLSYYLVILISYIKSNTQVNYSFFNVFCSCFSYCKKFKVINYRTFNHSLPFGSHSELKVFGFIDMADVQCWVMVYIKAFM